MKSARKRLLAVLLAVLMLIPAAGTMVFAVPAENTELTSDNNTNVILEAEVTPNSVFASNTATPSTDYTATLSDSDIAAINIDPIYIDNWDRYEKEEWSEELGEWLIYESYDWISKLRGTITYTDGTTGEFNGSWYEDNDGWERVSYSDNQSYKNSWEVGSTYTGTISFLGYTIEVQITICKEQTTDNFRVLENNDGIVITRIYGSGDVLNIPDTINGKPVIAITSLDCWDDGYKEIVIPDSVISLSHNVCSYNNYEKITIGAGVKTIANSMFEGCDNLTELAVSSNNANYTSVDGIVYDKNLTTMVAIPLGKVSTHTVPATVTNIDSYFNYSYKFDIVLQNDATGYMIEDGIIYNADKTVVYSCSPDRTGDYVMPNTVETISPYAFYMSNLKSVTVSSKVTDIAYYSFNSCPNLEKVVLPDTLTTISRYSFTNSEQLSDISLPSSLTTLEEYAFCNTGVKTITIPGSVYYVDYFTFAYSDLENLTICNGVERIGDSAFYNTKIKTVSIPSSVWDVGSYAFGYTPLQSVSLGNGLKYIDQGAFCDTELTMVVFPKSLLTIGAYAFAYSKLTSLYIPSNVTDIGRSAFYGCPIKTFTLAEGHTTTYAHAFRGMGIESLTLPQSVTDVAYYSFADCENLSDIDLPDNLESLCGHAFDGSSWLNNQPSGVVYLEQALYGYKGDMPTGTKVAVKSGTKLIADYAFDGESNLNSIELPSSLKVIGEYAFYETGLKNIYIPNSVTAIDHGAFSYCDSLTDIYCEAESQPDGWAYYWKGGCGATVHWGCKFAKITKQPTSVTVLSGKTAKVTVTTSGDGLTYKWYFKNKGDSKFTLTTTFTGNTYSAEMNSTRAGRQVYCVITDKYGNSVKTNTVTLGMIAPAKIITQPTNVAVQSGKTAKVTVTASGDGLKYKWYYKNKGATKFTLTTSFTGNSYSVTMDSSRAGRQVYCVITDKYGNSVTSNTVTLGMPVKITKQPVSVAVQSGKTAKVTVTATGDGLKYKWYFKNKGASSFSLTTTFTGNTYSATMDSTRAGRQVYCVITDKYGNSVKTNTVTLGMAVKITTQPTSVKVANGKTAKVTVKASGEGLKYKWYFKDKGATKFTLTTSFTGTSYSVAMSNARAGRQVYCVITDKYGNSVKTNTVTLNKK